ncbi:nickel pincer cofactor biosynthesis protein LarC [soil metagenome]
MRVLYFDCFSGISGDMTVGALRDLGVEEKVFSAALEALGLSDEFHAHFRRGDRQNITGWKFDVHTHHPGPPAHEHGHEHEHEHGHEHGHGHEHHHHDSGHIHGRSFRAIRALIEASRLSDVVKARSINVFRRIAVAEGKIHGMPPDDVSFHEVGAIDSIADIVAACAGIEALGVERVFSSRLVEGSGWIQCAHGKFPLPAPATMEILAGIPLRQIDEHHELITPTGAALLAELASSFGPLPEMQIEKIGYGLGTRDTAPRPNVLRAVVGECTSTPDAEIDEIIQIETNLDDLTPELAGATMERLFEAGALDVFFTPAQMKKNRPGFLLTVLTTDAKSSELARIILTETSAFGVRMHSARRMKLRREFRDVETPYGSVRIKLGFLGDELVQAAPEYESCREVAKRSGVSVKDVHLAAWIGTPPKPVN